jgi:hypothetical protein
VLTLPLPAACCIINLLPLPFNIIFIRHIGTIG